VLRNGVLVAAVADGAGSAAASEIGAFFAADAAVHELASRLKNALPCETEDWHFLLRETLTASRRAVDAAAAVRGHDPLQLATTLQICAVTPECAAVAQVGDGAVVAQLQFGGFTSITRPPSEEFINETTFITSAAAVDKAQLAVLPGPIRGVAMFTDGLQMLALKMPEGEPHAPFFVPLLRYVANADDPAKAAESLKGFLQSPKITQRADDDLTLLLAVLDDGAAIQ
jgi:hypothetical protein